VLSKELFKPQIDIYQSYASNLCSYLAKLISAKLTEAEGGGNVDAIALADAQTNGAKKPTLL